MDDNKEKYKYVYNVEKLDKIIENMKHGIIPMLPDDVMVEVNLRKKELLEQSNVIDGDEEIDESETDLLLKRHKKMIDEKIEAERRRAHAEQFITIKISEKVKQKLYDECRSSYVRKTIDSEYHMDESQLYDSKERAELMKRVNKIKSQYFNVDDWKNAMMTLFEALKFSQEHDYMGMPKHMKEGHIKLNRPMPKLVINHAIQVTDKELLKKILNGEVNYVGKDKQVYPVANRISEKEAEGITLNKVGRVMGNREYEEHAAIARLGGSNSALIGVNKMKNNIFNRFTLTDNKPFINPRLLDENGNRREFDFTVEGSGKRIWNYINNKKPSLESFIRSINEANDGKLNHALSVTVLNDVRKSFNKDLISNNNRYSIVPSNQHMQPDPKVIAQEQALLNAMRRCNPNK